VLVSELRAFSVDTPKAAVRTALTEINAALPHFNKAQLGSLLLSNFVMGPLEDALTAQLQVLRCAAVLYVALDAATDTAFSGAGAEATDSSPPQGAVDAALAPGGAGPFESDDEYEGGEGEEEDDDVIHV